MRPIRSRHLGQPKPQPRGWEQQVPESRGPGGLCTQHGVTTRGKVAVQAGAQTQTRTSAADPARLCPGFPQHPP